MQQLDLAFTALADPTRRAIIARLAEGEATVSEIMAPFEITQPAISRHLKVLEQAGLIETRIDGQRRPRRLNPKTLEATTDWLERCRAVFEANYQRLDTLLEEMKLEEEFENRKGTKS